MRRELGGRAVYRSRAARHRRSVLVLTLLILLTLGLVVVVGSSGGRERVVYDRAAAVAYADRWALDRNPAYWSSPDADCANYVSQCLAAGGLRESAGPEGDWRSDGTAFPATAWVNCGRQKLVLSRDDAGHSPYIVRASGSLPSGWRRGDIVYLGDREHGRVEWKHVVICAGKERGRWVYDSHTTAYRRVTIGTWYPEHFSVIRYCRVADEVTYE